MAAQDTILNERYRLIAQQGSGGMSVVYKAQDLALRRTVAIKILRPSLTGDSSFLQRFQQEARNVANLHHPNIVTLHDLSQDGNTYYMVMEFIDGPDLKKLIRMSAPFSVERTLHIAIQICAGVGSAHRAGLVHADVKPQNILITDNDLVKVTDFGIAQALSTTQPQEKQSVVWGSPHYFSPEQASGEIPSPTADVYAIGIVMFEMLTGKLPYNGNDQQELAMAHIRDQVPHVMDVNPTVPIYLDRIIYKAMSKAGLARYRNADQLGRILISYQKQGQDMTDNVGTVTPAAPSGPAIISGPPSVKSIPIISNQPPTVSPTVVSGNSLPTADNTPPPYSLATPPAYTPYNPPANADNTPSQAFPAQSNLSGTGGMSLYPPLENSSRNVPNMARNAANYPIQPATAPTFDAVSLALGIIAFMAVIGLIILWVAVLNAYHLS